VRDLERFERLGREVRAPDSQCSYDDFRKHVLVEREVGDELLELAMLILDAEPRAARPQPRGLERAGC
jgi:hypothetical protein